MLTIQGPRQSGKTTALVAVCKLDPEGYLVISNRHAAKRMSMAFDLPLHRILIANDKRDLDDQLRGIRAKLYVDESPDCKLSEWAESLVRARCFS